MKITSLNFDDIIRLEKLKLRESGKNPKDYKIVWGRGGHKAFKDFHCVNGFKEKRVLYGMEHYFDENKDGFEVIRI